MIRLSRPRLLLLVLVLAALLPLGRAQQERYLDVLPELPLVTVGDEPSGRWTPSGDEFEFHLAGPTPVRLWLFSPTFDPERRGDESFQGDPGAAVARFALHAPDSPDGPELLVQGDFGVGASSWQLLWDAPLPAGRYVLTSDVDGPVKNVFLPLLELAGERAALRSVRPTVNVAGSAWRPAVGFELEPERAGLPRCELALYDAEGATELGARLRAPNGSVVELALPGDREWVRLPLPDAPGRYRIEVRQPDGAFQRSNAVRFMALCSDGPRPLEILAEQTLLTPAPTRAVPRPAAVVTVAPARPVPLPAARVEQLLPPAAAVPLPAVRIELRPAPEVPVAPPEADAAPPAESEPAPARLLVQRAFDPAPAGPCEPVRVALTVRNEGGQSGAYELLDIVPTGWRVVALDGAAGSGQPRWRGRLEPAAEAVHRYTVEPAAEARGVVRFESTLIDAGGSTRAASELALVAPGAALLAPGVAPVAGRPFEVTLRVVNPLPRPLLLTPTWSAQNLIVEGAPERLELPAGRTVEHTLRVTPENEGSARLRADLGCGVVAELGRGVAAAPTLPTATFRTTVTVDLAAWRLPARSGLVLVQHLPLGVRYLPGSARVDGEASGDPQRVRGALLFELPERTVASVVFEVVHAGPFDAAAAGSSVLARTPRPTLLLGDETDLALLDEAALPPVEIALPRSGDAVILEPSPGALLRLGRSAEVAVETPLGSTVALSLNGAPVADDRLAERVYDSGTGRQHFRYLGLRLTPGPNRLELRARSRDGSEWTDTVTVYAPGPAAGVEVAPLDPLVAGSAEPLRLELRVFDAWGNPPDDGAVTVEIDGAAPARVDRAPQQLGYQLAYANGRAELELLPVATPRSLRLRFFAGERELGEAELLVGSDLRSWLALGQGSAALGWRAGTASSQGSGLWFGVEGRFFARGPIWDDVLLTVGAGAPGNELAPAGDPYAAFPVPGSSATDRRDAVSRQGVFVRVERDLDYLQYGDFRPQLEGELLRPGGSLTGLSGAYLGELAGTPFTVGGYAALAPLRGRVDVEIPSDGTSTPGPLPQAPILEGSLELAVIKRDRNDPRLELNDGDPRLGPLAPRVDYTVIEESGFVQLARLLPLFDGDGNRYYLRASYRRAGEGSGPFGVQAGAQLGAEFGPATVRIGGYHQTREGSAWARVLSASTRLLAGPLEVNAELAWGSDEASAGAGASVAAAWRAEGAAAEVRWRWLDPGYRAADVQGEGQGGHSVAARALVEVAPGLGIGADADLATETTTDGAVELRLGGGAALYWQGSAPLQIGELHLASAPSAELGVAWRDGPFLTAGVMLRELAGIPGAELSLRHQQSLGAAASSSDLAVGYRIGEWLTLRAGQRITWGQGSRLLLGVEAGADHAELLGGFCAATGCALLPAQAIPGRSVVSAELELPGGLPGESGRALIGLDTTLPLTDAVALDLHLEREIGLVAPDRSDGAADPALDATVAAVGARFEGERIDASLRYELRLADVTKQTLSGGVSAALGETFTVALRGVVQSVSDQPDLGLRVTAAAAYRGSVDLLTRHELFRGPLAGGDARIEGDTRLRVPLGTSAAGALDLQASYLYSVRPDVGWQDLTGLGLIAHPWQGGSVSASAQLFHDWTLGEWLPGVGLEVAQNLGCGVYGAVGGTAFGGRPSAGATLREPGVYLRLDVVVDESWRCGRGALAGRVLDTDGAPVAGVLLLLRRAGGAEVGRAVSDETGGYRFARLEPGRYLLEAVPPRGAAWVGEGSFEIDLAPSAQRRLPDLTIAWEQP